jgi:enamine deaminase RidA (YjgF/YER057c/UK114 family)
LAVRTGDLLHFSGHVPQKADGSLWTGKVGGDLLTVEQGYESARCCAIQLLATLQQQVGGDWSRVVRVVKVVGFVQCTDDFHHQPSVINGASDLLVQVLGPEVGKHARSAVGTNALPLNIATEVECIVEIQD